MSLHENPYQPPTTEELSTSPVRSGQPEPATRGSRLAAAFIDGASLFLLIMPLQWALGVYDDFQAYQHDRAQQLVWGLVGIVAWMALNAYPLATRAQSIGKMALGIKIVTLDGQNADFKRIMLRRLLPMWGLGIIPIIGGFVSTVDSVSIFRKDQRCIHDEIAGTRVVRV